MPILPSHLDQHQAQPKDVEGSKTSDEMALTVHWGGEKLWITIA